MNALGVPLAFDAQTLEVRLDGAAVRVEEHARDGMDVYRTYYPDRFPDEIQAALDSLGLTCSFVAVRPLFVDGEYARTRGHVHPAMLGSTLGYPEIYLQLAGKLLVLMQQAGSLIVAALRPGDAVTIPPGYAHRLVNPYGAPGLLAGLYGCAKLFKPDYESVASRGGFAFRVVAAGEGRYSFEPNERYDDVAQLSFLAGAAGTEFEVPAPCEPLLTSLFRQPDAYAFLTDPAAARDRFDGETGP